MLGIVKGIATAAATAILLSKVVNGSTNKSPSKNKPPRKSLPNAASAPPNQQTPAILPSRQMTASNEPRTPPPSVIPTAFWTVFFVLIASSAVCLKRGMWDVGGLLIVAAALLCHVQVPSLRQPASAAPVSRPPVPRVDFSGVWIKDAEQSDSLDEALDLIQLRGLVRAAVGLIRGLELKQSDSTFHVAVFSIISWFKVVERYSMCGEPAQWKRRDLRRGKHTGRVRLDDNGQRLCLELDWQEPFAGRGLDEFVLVDPDTLHVRSTVMCQDRKAQYTVVYRRKR